MSGQRSDLRISDDLKHRQGIASNPELSAWVSANAGAGKTYVLTRRVTRLLLGGAEPSRILCLTYTKAAAANMANRVFGDLETWAKLGDAALRAELAPFVDRPTDADLARARRLFARAIETPGGLKVQTIHAFCQGLLQAFPFEANVPASFQVMDEVQTREMLARARDAVMTHTEGEESAFSEALQALAMERAPGSLAGHLDAAVAARRDLAKWLGRDGAGEMLNAGLGLAMADSVDALAADIAGSPVLPRDAWAEAAALLSAGSASLQTMAGSLAAAASAQGDAMSEAYFDSFLTKTMRTVPSRFLTKDFRADHSDMAERLEREAERAQQLHERFKALVLAERSRALFTLAGGIIAVFERAKQARGLMEFQDLIDSAARLLAPEGNRWVLYKLDGGLDHVLLDEAQDTSPPQWEIIKNLTDEFFVAEAEASAAAGGEAGRDRTVFAVGDEKQSIFSFQGARPKTFDEERRRIETAAGEAGRRFETVPIETSFRSAPDILRAVDKVFGTEEMHADLTAPGLAPHHESARPDAPSLVELWAPCLPSEAPDERAWDAPLDAPDEGSPPERLAERIARRIEALIAGGVPPGEILVLVRGRNAAFEAVIRALRQRHVPVAGADRLKLLEQIAVLDLLALADVLLCPDDDLALATVLKSPLIDFADAEMDAETRLFHVAHNRDGSLWRALDARGETDPICARAARRLRGWRDRAAYARPFEFFAEVLGAGGGRRAFLARLGSEAGDALDELLGLALAFEERAVPTLQAFVHDLRQTEREVKRELSEAGDTVRVMTVHNAKGLEAQAVFLVCTGQKIMDGTKDPAIFALDDAPGAPLVYAPSAKGDPPAIAQVRADVRLARAAEERRLLYVAMTRAKSWLYVGACRGKRAAGEAAADGEPALMPDGETWHGMIARALGEEAERCEAGDGASAWVWPRRSDVRPEAWDMAAPAAASHGQPEETQPSWLCSDAPQARPMREVSPSRLVSAQHAAGASTPIVADDGGRGASRDMPPGALDPLRRGTLVHHLLQSLPELAPDARDAAGRAYLAARGADLTQEQRDALLTEAMHVLGHPELAPLFSGAARAEVDVIGTVRRGSETLLVEGRIDRLLVEPGRVLLVDFKTDAVPPATPEAIGRPYLAQLAAYRDLLARTFPDRSIEAWLVWTAGPSVMAVSDALLDAAAGQAADAAAA